VEDEEEDEDDGVTADMTAALDVAAMRISSRSIRSCSASCLSFSFSCSILS